MEMEKVTDKTNTELVIEIEKLKQEVSELRSKISALAYRTGGI